MRSTSNPFCRPRYQQRVWGVEPISGSRSRGRRLVNLRVGQRHAHRPGRRDVPARVRGQQSPHRGTPLSAVVGPCLWRRRALELLGRHQHAGVAGRAVSPLRRARSSVCPRIVAIGSCGPRPLVNGTGALLASPAGIAWKPCEAFGVRGSIVSTDQPCLPINFLGKERGHDL